MSNIFSLSYIIDINLSNWDPPSLPIIPYQFFFWIPSWFHLAERENKLSLTILNFILSYMNLVWYIFSKIFWIVNINNNIWFSKIWQEYQLSNGNCHVMLSNLFLEQMFSSCPVWITDFQMRLLVMSLHFLFICNL